MCRVGRMAVEGLICRMRVVDGLRLHGVRGVRGEKIIQGCDDIGDSVAMAC